MKLCFLADGQDVHAQKWLGFFAHRGYEVHLITFRKGRVPNIVEHSIRTRWPLLISPDAPMVAKMGYFVCLNRVKRRIREISPDLLHAHWASSYGFLGAHSSYHPYVLSTWGSDVFDFPKKSFLHRQILRYTINRADYLTATSKILTDETKKFLVKGKEIHTIPFGVDLGLFKPSRRKARDGITVGIVKRLEKKYGIEYLIQAIALLVQRRVQLDLFIIGKGSEEEKLKELSRRLHVGERVHFFGFVENHRIPDYLNRMDIFVVPSAFPSETFGVAAVEAAACRLPVVASNIGGLPEVVLDGETGFLVPPRSSEALADKIWTLIQNPGLRRRMGQRARRFVEENYGWEKNALRMDRLYRMILESKD